MRVCNPSKRITTTSSIKMISYTLPVSFRKSSWSHFHCVWKDSCWFWISSKTHLKHSKTTLFGSIILNPPGNHDTDIVDLKKTSKTFCEQKKSWKKKLIRLRPRTGDDQTSADSPWRLYNEYPMYLFKPWYDFINPKDIRNDTLCKLAKASKCPGKSPCTHWETLMLQENPHRALTFSTLLNTELSSVFNIMFNCVCGLITLVDPFTCPHLACTFMWCNVPLIVVLA